MLIRTDNTAGRSVLEGATKGRHLRWALALQELDYTLVERPGKSHCNADALSRCHLRSACPYGEKEVESIYASQATRKDLPPLPPLEDTSGRIFEDDDEPMAPSTTMRKTCKFGDNCAITTAWHKNKYSHEDAQDTPTERPSKRRKLAPDLVEPTCCAGQASYLDSTAYFPPADREAWDTRTFGKEQQTDAWCQRHMANNTEKAAEISKALRTKRRP